MKKPILSLTACAIALCSCAAKKAVIVEEAPVKPVEDTAASEPPPAPLPDANDDGGFRLPDMFDMPDENQLKSTPGLVSGDSGRDGTIITQPPRE